MKKLTSIIVILLWVMTAFSQNTYISEKTIQNTCSEILKETKISSQMVNRGITQTASLWTEADGTEEEFMQFCLTHFCKNPSEKELLFNRLCDNFETIMGHNHAMVVNLCLPIHVTGYKQLPIDEMFASYDVTSHFTSDMFDTKIAFVVTMNFPHYTLKEKVENADKWSNLEWGYARLGDWFTSRVPADKLQAISAATTAADSYISNYNICM